MRIKFLNKINLARSSGLCNFLIIDIGTNTAKILFVKRKEIFYKIKNGDILSNLEIVAQTEIECANDLAQIGNSINQLVKEKNLSNISAKVGISEYKLFNLSIPAETEDEELWFMENTQKFLPEGRTTDEFIYSYQCCVKDENYKYFQAAIARRDYIERVEKIVSNTEINLISVAPFLTQVQFPAAADSVTDMLINVTSDRINYLIRDTSGKNVPGYLYNTGRDINSIKNIVEEIYQNYQMFIKKEEPEALRIYLSCADQYYEAIKNEVLEKFKSKSVNTELKEYKPEVIGHLLVLNHLFYNAEKINLLNKDRLSESRYKIEKQLSLRFIIACGVLILALLLFAFTVENYFSGKQDEESADVQGISTLKNRIELIKKENQNLKSNFKILRNLKGKKEKYSRILFDLSGLVSENSYLTGLEIKEDDKSGIMIELNGIASSQQEVAEFINRMEQNKRYNTISLLRSTLMKAGDENFRKVFLSKQSVEFKISYLYHAD